MFSSLRLLEHIHGHAGWLAVAVLVHPAIFLRRRRRRAHLAVGLAVIVPTLVWVLGALLYPPYRAQIRPGLFQRAAGAGLMFERKEHLAFGVIALAWCGAIAYFGSWRSPESVRDRLHALAQRAFAVAAALAGVVALLGVWVASHGTF